MVEEMEGLPGIIESETCPIGLYTSRHSYLPYLVTNLSIQ